MRRQKPTIKSQDALVELCDRQQEELQAKEQLIAAFREEIDGRAIAQEKSEELCRRAETKIAELHEARVEALDMLRHMQAEAMFWRGVAMGMDPERAAHAEIARKGQRFGDLADRMNKGTDPRDGRSIQEREGRPMSAFDRQYGRAYTVSDRDVLLKKRP